jgi:branched-chain amino acid transport system substrate-binding protein
MTKVEKISSSRKLKIPPIIWFLLIIAGFVGAKSLKGNTDSSSSMGEQLLIKEMPTIEAKRGVEAYRQGRYPMAIAAFQRSLAQQPNNPETLIYLLNAQAQTEEHLKIAVVIPISSNLDIAQEILRGVAMAQLQINQAGGIQGKLMQVQIYNDQNEPEIAKQIAEKLVEDPNVLAVIGHNSSNASVAAAPIYQKGGLVMITPTSFANDLSGFGSYIFRTVPKIHYMTDALAEYVVKQARKNKVAVCYDSKAPDNVSSKDEFVASFLAQGGKLAPTVCDFSAPNFDANQAITDAVSSGADSLFLGPHIDRLNQVIDLVRANHEKLPLFSTPTLYTIKTLQSGQKDVNGLVIPVPWHPQATQAAQNFATQARQIWKAEITIWRTATAYDATRAIITGLQSSQTRDGLQSVLKRPGFVAPQGANGDVQFLPTGDRLGKAVLIQVQPSASGYQFVPIQAQPR